MKDSTLKKAADSEPFLLVLSLLCIKCILQLETRRRILPGHRVVSQNVLQQVRVRKEDDPENGSKALVSDGGAGGGAVHLVQDPEQGLDEALGQVGVVLHQLCAGVLPPHLLVAPWRYRHSGLHISHCCGGLHLFIAKSRQKQGGAILQYYVERMPLH